MGSATSALNLRICNFTPWGISLLLQATLTAMVEAEAAPLVGGEKLIVTR